MALRRTIGILAGASALAVAVPALADVEAGVDAWTRGDYSSAIAEWSGPASQGDADAQFNMGQAYRLGMGVPTDLAMAESFYAQAAAQGHIRATDTYGLMLFQGGKKQDALPYLQEAAARGDPRSQYLLGISHFNGNLVAKDWVRAYALMTMANSQGLPQAAPVLAEMDGFIPMNQREQAAALAVELQREAEATRARQLASAELGDGAFPQQPTIQQAAIPTARQNSRSGSDGALQPARIAPTVAEARAAIAEAIRVTGTESPDEAGADFARGPSLRQTASAPVARPAATQPNYAQPVGNSQPAAMQSGPWKVQLGAFSVAANADKLWRQLSSRSELAGRQKLMVPAGRVTKLQAGGYASATEANAACRSLKGAGHDCLVTR